jgi:iron complex outermembrane receptor protein
MKKFLFIIYVLLSFMIQIGNSQNSLVGKISLRDRDQPLPGVIIYLPDLKQGAISSVDGSYILNNLPSGTFLVEIKSIGYKTIITNQKISGASRLDVSMEESAVEINEVIVTGSVSATQKLLNPIPLTSVNKYDLQRSAATNIIDALSAIPGISQISTGFAVSKPVIRGLGYNRVLVLHDDIRQEGQQWGDEHGVEIDENSISKIEIIKGPGSLAYGSDALAGVLNFISTPSLPEGKMEGNIQANYITNNRLMDYSAYHQGNIRGFNWLIRGTYKQAGNFRNNYDKAVYNSGFNERNLNGYIGLTKKWGYSFLRLSTFNQELGMIEGERDSLGRFLALAVQPGKTVAEVPVYGDRLNQYGIDIPKQKVSHNRAQLNSRVFIGEGSLQSDFGYQQNNRREYSDPELPDTAELFFMLKSVNYNFKYNFPKLAGWQNIAGIGGMIQSNTNKADEQLIPDFSLNDLGLFFTSQKTWDKLHLSAGLRFDSRSIETKTLLKENKSEPALPSDYKFRGFRRNFSNVSVSAGISKNISQSTILKLNYAKGFRAPNLAELSTNGKHEGTFRYEYGNQSLTSEKSNQVDAGLTFNTHHVALEFNTFVNNVVNYIYIQKLSNVEGTDSIPDPADSAPAFRFEQGNAVLYGGEISLDIHPHPYDYLHILQSFSIVKGFLKNRPDSARNLPFIPAPMYRAEIRIQPLKVKSMQRPYIMLEYKHFFEKDDVFSAYNTETPSSGYGLLNFGIGSGLISKKGKELFSIHFQITNVMNTVYQNHLSRLKYAPVNPATNRRGIYNPGRSLSIKLEIPIHLRE